MREPSRPSPPGVSDLESAEFLRTEFLDRIAHELRGPAGVTLGALDELTVALGEKAEAHRSHLAMARRGALRVLRTADRLTRAGQLEAGSVTFTRLRTDLRELVRRASADATALEGRSLVKVVIDQPEAACIVSVDPGWVQAALTELVSQALRLASREVRIEITREAHLLVTNDGSSARPFSARFEPRADRGDTGLAMPLVRQVALAHGGELSLESHEGGTTARLSFGPA